MLATVRNFCVRVADSRSGLVVPSRLGPVGQDGATRAEFAAPRTAWRRHLPRYYGWVIIATGSYYLMFAISGVCAAIVVSGVWLAAPPRGLLSRVAVAGTVSR